MPTSATETKSEVPRTRIAAPPIPHEHGAWVILYAPALVAFGALREWPGWPGILLLAAVTVLFLARNAAGLLIRGRDRGGVTVWLGIYALVAAAAAVPLLLRPGGSALMAIGVAAAALFGVNAILIRRSTRKRLDRSHWGELLAIAALTLTAPAAYAVATGTLDAMALALWTACTLFYGSGIFFVKMLLEAVKVRGAFVADDRRRAGRQNLAYHLLLTAAISVAAVAIGSTEGILLAVAFAPVLIRAFYGYAKLTNKLPPLKRVGMRETLYALWFSAAVAIAAGM